MAAPPPPDKRSSFVSSTGSTNSTLTGAGSQIPLTVKNLEDDYKRKSVLDGSLDSWDYVYRQLESIGYSKDQVRITCGLFGQPIPCVSNTFHRCNN